MFLSGGPGGSPESLATIVDYVSGNNRSILLHQRGTGLSSAGRTDSSTISLDRFIGDINDVLQNEGINRFYIIGHSWGAMLALEYMTRFPERVDGSVLIGSSGYGLDFVQRMNNEIFSRMNATQIDSVKVYIHRLNTSKDPVLLEDTQNKFSMLVLSQQFQNPANVSELLKSGPMNMRVNQLMLKDLQRLNWNLQDKLGVVESPVLIINGAYDPIDKKYVQELARSLKHADLHFLDNSGHYVWIETPEETRRLILEFLKEN